MSDSRKFRTLPVDAEFVQINTSVLDGLAEVAFLDVSGR